MLEWTEATAVRAILAEGGRIRYKAISDPGKLTRRVLSAIDYLKRYHGYYRR